MENYYYIVSSMASHFFPFYSDVPPSLVLTSEAMLLKVSVQNYKEIMSELTVVSPFIDVLNLNIMYTFC